MIKFLALWPLSLSVLAIDFINPQLFFAVGYPYQSIQENSPAAGNDFLSANIGAVMRFNNTDKSSYNIVIDSSYTPQHDDVRLAPKGQVIEGRASIITALYSVTYEREFSEHWGRALSYSIGPTIGTQTFNYDSFQNNNTQINAKNRVLIRNWGVRTSLLLEQKNSYWELGYYFLRQNQVSVINDSTLDAEAIETDDNVENEPSWTVLINYGMRIF